MACVEKAVKFGLDRARGQDQRGAELLRQAMAIEPENAGIHHALGLLLVRQHDYAAALPLLRQASELAPDNARYAYVYAIALNSAGQPRQAIALLEQAHKAHPADWDLLSGAHNDGPRYRRYLSGTTGGA